MSGPKVDVASIRRQEMERLAQARDQRCELSKKINDFLKELAGGNGDLCEETTKELKKLLRTVKLGNELLDIDVITRKAETLMKTYRVSVGKLEQARLVDAQRKAEVRTMNSFQYSVSKIRRREMVTGEEDDEDVVISQAQVKEQEELFVEEMNRIMQSNEISKKGRKTLLILHQDLQELISSELSAERKYKRMNRMLDEFEKTVNLLKKDLQGMQEIYEEYLSEVFDLDMEPRVIDDFASAEEIREAIAEAKDAALGKMSKEYIKRQIDEVMQKHGYDVVRSDMLAQVNESGQILYGVDEETAINVFVSEDSQVTMRVVGIGFDSQISGEEDERLFQQQCAFCSLHPQITKELEMRGVILHTKKHMPPDKKFNKKIQTKEKSGMQTMSRAKKELKKTEQKVMHRE